MNAIKIGIMAIAMADSPLPEKGRLSKEKAT